MQLETDIGGISLLPTLAVMLVSFFILTLRMRSREHWERNWVMVNYGARILATFLLIWLMESFFRRGDMFLYLEFGSEIADMIRTDGISGLFNTALIFFQQDPDIGFVVPGVGRTTGSMTGLVGFLLYITGGSAHAVALIFTFVSLLGQLELYVAVRRLVPDVNPRWLMVATLWIPSVMIWSSGIVKESLAIAALGLVLSSLVYFRAGLPSKAWWRFVVGAIAVAMIKQWLLVPIIIATAATLAQQYRQTGRGRGAPIATLMVLGALVAWIVAGSFVPRIAISNIASEVQEVQEAGLVNVGGSSFSLAEPGADRSLTAQINLVPAAVANSLFRPFLFESTAHLFSLLAALEATLLTLLLARALIINGVRGTIRTIQNNSYLMFAAVFTAIAAVGVGLGTNNLGTLVRYRTPMVILYLPLLLLLNPGLFPSRKRMRVRHPRLRS